MQKIPGHNWFFLTRMAWRHATTQRGRMVMFYAMFIIANIALSFQPIALAQIINAAQHGGAAALRQAMTWSAIYGGLTLFFWCLHGPARIIERHCGFHVYQNFVAQLYRMVTEMPLRWHQDHHSGSTINRVNKAGKALFNFAQGQFVPIQITVRFCASVVVLVYYSWWVAAVSLASSVVIMLVIRRFDRKLVPLVRQSNESEHHLNAGLYDYIGNIITVLTLRMQGNTSDELSHRFDTIRQSFRREVMVNEWKWGTINLLLIATQVGIVGAYIGLHLLRDQALALGSVVAIFQALLMITQQFFQGSLTFEQMLYHTIDVHGVDGLVAAHDKLGIARAASDRRDWRRIAITGLFFRHQEGEDKLHHLRDINLAIAAGQKIALVGSSGSGKTTLLTLLRGLYDAPQVQLAIDDKVFTDLAALAGFTTLVPQDSEIFENTVRYNLTLGTDVAASAVQQALAITTFADVVPKLPNGIDTDIRERGVNLSGGQKQRLALTRGLIAARDSSLLLLDEPTSSVDLPTESRIFDGLFAACADKAIVASIHRLHLLPRFDQIVLMRDGAIIEQGSFVELMMLDGEFRLLWQQHLAHTGDDDRALSYESMT